MANLVLDSFYPLAVPGSCLLFFFRAKAVYGPHRLIVILFGLLWIAVLASCITVPFGGGAINIGDTRYCLTSELKAYTGAAGIVPTVHDTVVFLAVSYKLMSHSFVEPTGFRGNVQTFTLGTHLPAFSRALFRDGQLYYMSVYHSNLFPYDY